MARFLGRRFALGLITLFLLSLIVFFGANILPGDVGRRILGPFAEQSAVDALNARLGTDRSIIVQYWDWMTGVLTGDLGTSTRSNRPVADIVSDAFVNSAKLAVLGFILVVPLAIAGG